MKFRNISVQDDNQNHLLLRDLASGLNVVYGDNGTGKTTIRHFLRGMLNGFTSYRSDHSSTSRFPMGNIEVSSLAGDLRISRNTHDSDTVSRIESIGNQSVNVPTTINQLNGNIDQKTFDEILNVGFRENTDSRSLTSELTSRFGVPRGKIDPIQIDHAAIREREALATRTRELLSELNRRRDILDRQLSETEQISRTEIDGLTTQINDLSDRIRSVEEIISSLQRRASDLDLEIDELRLQIERLRNQTQTVNVRRRSDHLPTLLSKLDAIDKQILRWRKVHDDVQTQRNKLHNEMLNWAEEDISDRQLLPYEEIRQLLNSLEGRVGDLDTYVGQIRDSNLQIEKGQDVTGNMRTTLSSMKDEVYQLCRELNSQHLVYRRKTTVNELKQLRRCYVEVTDHVKRLVTRRDEIIREVAKIDPARAELIVNSHHEMCECNYHDQYLADHQVVDTPVYEERRVNVDVSAELARLHQLEDDRRRLQTDIDSYQADISDLVRRRDDLIHRRDGLKIDNSETIRREHAEVNRRITSENDRLQALLRQLELDRRIPEQRANPLLENASRYLCQMTDNELTRIWISEASDVIVAQNHVGSQTDFGQLSRSGKDQVRLAICLAANNALHEEGIHLPIVLDDAFVNIDDSSTRDTAEVLLDYCRDDRQIVLFTCHRSVSEAFEKPGVKVLTLPERRIESVRTESPAPVATEYIRPRRVDSSRNYYSERQARDYVEPQDLPTSAVVDTKRYDRPATSSRSVSAKSIEFDEATHLADTRLMGNDNIGSLRRLGIRTIGDLLNFDPTSKHHELSVDGIDLDQIDAWQSQALLMIVIPNLRATDAVMLYSCGITDLEKLTSINGDELHDRVRQFSDSTRGRRMMSSGYKPERSRLNSWIDHARSKRDRYRNRRRWNLSDRSRQANGSRRDNDQQSRVNQPRTQAPRETRSYDGVPRAYNPSGERTSKGSEIQRETPKSTSAEQSKQKFYLSRTSNVEAAPTIGPKTAEKLEAVGIVTVQNLLDTPAEQIAKLLGNKRMKAEDILSWQQQATLVCRIPQLRGHDSQFLVACGITSAEELSQMEPNKLFSIVGPFAKTREGQKICRSGKMPDLAEITDWINWSKQNRTLSAA